MAKGVLIDLTRCIGCRGCQVACKEWNERSAMDTKLDGNFTNPKELNYATYKLIEYREREFHGKPAWDFVMHNCFHCNDPACASVCPVSALKKTEAGPVVYRFDRCIGCRYCMLACPFYIPKYEWHKAVPWVQKCTFCSERIENGVKPACIKACPTGTMFYGEREDVLSEARKRMSGSPGKYVDHIYGEKEAGGTSWMYISSVPFKELGFNMDIPAMELPDLTWKYISKIPAVIGVVLVAGGVSWAITRRNKNAGKEE
jgi:formate dehydrogenase iron-sulfur subunit